MFINFGKWLGWSELKGKKVIGTHTRPDLDAIAAIYLWKTFGEKNSEISYFSTRGDVEEQTALQFGIEMFDRGKGEFDHHKKNNQPETSTSLTAKKLNLMEDKVIQRLIKKVERSDLQGESLPFDVSDLIKCMQRVETVTDKKIIEMGMRIVHDCLKFNRQKLQRNNAAVGEIIKEFLADKKIAPKFQHYLRSLANPRFERPFDLVEIYGAGEEKEFILKLLEIEYKDSINYLNATEEVRKAWKITVKGFVVVADFSDNPRFKDAARNDQKALITIQRRSNGQTQIYFDTERIDDELVENLTAMIRLEECLIQKRQIPKENLRKSEWVNGIPEWYYFKAPSIPGKKKKPGRFILNGSITAPEVPPSQIPLETLREIAVKAVQYYPKFNWVRWKAERLAYYLSKKPS